MGARDGRLVLASGEVSRRKQAELSGFRVSYTTRNAGKVFVVMVKREVIA